MDLNFIYKRNYCCGDASTRATLLNCAIFESSRDPDITWREGGGWRRGVERLEEHREKRWREWRMGAELVIEYQYLWYFFPVLL